MATKAEQRERTRAEIVRLATARVPALEDLMAEAEASAARDGVDAG